MSNIINAIINLVNNPITDIKEYYKGNNRANNTGDALEEYVKDIFSNTFNDDVSTREKKIKQTFSYLGNSSNPPDAVLINGDVIEVKKIESKNSAIALNSSYPKQKLYRNSSMINKNCKEIDGGNWREKDVIYVVGVVSKGNNLAHLCMVYGSDYCASDRTYSTIKETIKTGVESIPNIVFVESKELGHINKVDPLGVTYMRVRGMWGIDNPWKVFSYIYERDMEKQFNFMSIINEEKWNSFDNTDVLIDLSRERSNLKISDVKIKNPDDVNETKNVKLVEFSF